MVSVNLSKISLTYPGAPRPAVHNLTLSVGEGSVLCLLGPSGCGKTTVLKIISGLLRPDSGVVSFGDRDVGAIKPNLRGAVMVFQNQMLFPFMNVGENVGFGLKMRRLRRNEIARRVSEMLDLVGLHGFASRKTAALSGGQGQRVALARALIINPRVLLLDEPLSSLDAHLRGEMRQLILQLQRKLRLTVIFVTHDQEEAAMLSDKIALMFDGVLQQYGEVRDFYDRPASSSVAAFFGNRNTLVGTKRGKIVETAHGAFTVAEDALPTGARLADGPVMMLIRPEHIDASPARATATTGANTIRVPVVAHVYHGFYTRYQVLLGKNEWSVTTNREIAIHGNAIDITLPPDKIRLLGVE